MTKKNPHDKLFSATFSRRKTAIEFIQQFLPRYIGSHLDFRSFKLENKSFIDSKLSEFFSDIIYSCRWKATDIQVIFLFEHKSYHPQFPHLQLLRYLLEGYEYQIRQGLPLTVILPIVLYHDKKEWKYRTFEDYFTLPDPRLKSFIPSFEYLLVNLKESPDEELFKLKVSFLMTTLLLFKHKNEKEFLEQLSEKLSEAFSRP